MESSFEPQIVRFNKSREHATNCLGLGVWKQMSIAAPLFVRLMSDPIVDHTLVNSQ